LTKPYGGERGYQELKSELGLHHYEGRNWRDIVVHFSATG
jgi:SRSO17 transposase